MKRLLCLFTLLLPTLFVINANAGKNFSCVGKDNEGKDTQIDLVFETDNSVLIIDLNGDERTLDLVKKTSKVTVFGDYEWDGYGGSIELILPSSAKSTVKKFKALYKQKIFSELGHVGSVSFKGNCQSINN